MVKKVFFSAMLVFLLTACSSGTSPEEVAQSETSKYTAVDIAKFQAAKDSLLPKTDTIEGFTLYKDERAEQYVDSKTAIVPSIFQGDGEAPILLLRYQYVGPSWIFWQSLIVAIDDQRLDDEFAYSDMKRDNSGGTVWEYHTVELSESGIQVLEDIASSESTTIRFKGDKGSRDLVLTDEDKAMVKTTVEGYKWLLWDYQNNQ